MGWEGSTGELPGVTPGGSVHDGGAQANGALSGEAGDDWRGRLAETLRFARRQVTGEGEVDEFGFDPEFNTRLLMPLARLLYQQWFRVEMRGLEHVPSAGGALLVANHSGVLPFDAIMLQTGLHDEHPQHRNLRLLGADLVYEIPGLAYLARRAGHTRACPANADRLLHDGELVGVFPEGFGASGNPSATVTSCAVSAGAGSRSPPCGPGCRSCPARSSAPRRSTRWSATPGRSPGCSGCLISRSRPCSPGSARWARSRCRPSGSSTSARRWRPPGTRRARGGTRR